jgi:hypothetical protein
MDKAQKLDFNHINKGTKLFFNFYSAKSAKQKAQTFNNWKNYINTNVK